MKLKRQVTYRPELVEKGVELSVRHLKQYFSFGHGRGSFKTKAVHDVSFDILKGECFGLVGESGCGKTTTGRSLIRLYNITSGSIYFEGYRISAGKRWNEKEIKWSRIKGHNKIKEIRHETSLKLKEEKDATKRKEISSASSQEIKNIKKHIKETRKEQKEAIAQIKYDNKHVDRKLMSRMQMIFQDPVDSLDPRMTVEDIIQEGLRIQGENNRFANSRKVAEVLERVGLIPEYASRYPHEFSGGQRQRIGIARALVMNPKFLICDEPISALDVSIRAQIINLLNDLKEEMGLTIMFIAHDLSVVKYFCDRIGVMYFGQLVELATSDELFKHPLHPYTNALLSAIPKPDPISEKKRQRIVYKPDEVHDYSVDKPELVEIVPGHWVLANKKELQEYKAKIRALDADSKESSNAIAVQEALAKKAEMLAKKEIESVGAEERARKERLEAEHQAKIAAQREARLAQDKARDELTARREALLEERRRARRSNNNVVPPILKEERKPVENKELSQALRRERATSVKKDDVLYGPISARPKMFMEGRVKKEEYPDLKMFHQEKVQEKQPEVISKPSSLDQDVARLSSTKLVYLTKNKQGKYQLKQVGEASPIVIKDNKEEAIAYAEALKRVNGVSVCIRDDDGRMKNL